MRKTIAFLTATLITLGGMYLSSDIHSMSHLNEVDELLAQNGIDQSTIIAKDSIEKINIVLYDYDSTTLAILLDHSKNDQLSSSVIFQSKNLDYPETDPFNYRLSYLDENQYMAFVIVRNNEATTVDFMNHSDLETVVVGDYAVVFKIIEYHDEEDYTPNITAYDKNHNIIEQRKIN